MKKLIGLLVALLLSSSPLVASESDETVKFEVAEMTCATCPIAVKKAMQRVDGVIDVEVSYEDKTAVVTFDPKQTTPDEIGQASTDVGFPATVTESK